jgi:hypothetical protein
MMQARRGWHPNSGLPEFGINKCRKSGKPDVRDKPGHDGQNASEAPLIT